MVADLFLFGMCLLVAWFIFQVLAEFFKWLEATISKVWAFLIEVAIPASILIGVGVFALQASAAEAATYAVPASVVIKGLKASILM